MVEPSIRKSVHLDIIVHPAQNMNCSIRVLRVLTIQTKVNNIYIHVVFHWYRYFQQFHAWLFHSGQSSDASCQPCVGGQYCEGIANTMPDGNCSAGYFCASGSSSATPITFGNVTVGSPAFARYSIALL